MTKLLLVDDNSAFLRMYGKILELIGFDVIGAPGEEECMHILQSERPDLILLDIMMEPHDGWDTLLSIRENTLTRDVPVVILTGKRPTVDEIDRFGGDIEDYLMKPVRKSELKEVLEHTLERMRRRAFEIEAAHGRGCSTSELAAYIRLERAVRMDEKFRPVLVEMDKKNIERARLRREQRDAMKEKLNIR